MTAAPAAFAPPSWSRRLWDDLQPGPGRLAATLRIVLATVIALVVMMVLQMPFAALGLYYIFLVVRESPTHSVRSGVMALLTLALAIAAELAVVVVTDNDPMARFLSVGIAAFVAGTLMAASTLPPLASIWGFIYCTVIALWERPAPADALVKASLYLFATVTTAFLCSVLVEYLFAFRTASDRLSGQIKLRYGAIAGVYNLLAQDAPPAKLGASIVGLNRLAGTGQGAMQLLHAEELDGGGKPTTTRVQITLLAELMDMAAAFASQHPAGVTPELRARCAALAAGCQTQKFAWVSDAQPATGLLGRVEAALQAALTHPEEAAPGAAREVVELPAAATPFLIPGALQNKDTIAFALKITLCVMICYIFYFAVAWPGISTSVTTVFITALGNSGAIKQKLANRFVGSAIGGALAMFATAFLFPYMDSIFSLVVLIGIVAFISAWWACGRQFGYAGLQIAFAFYLVAFEGFSAPTELAPARDRLIGILVALFVIWLVFDQLWPVRTIAAMRGALAGVLRMQSRLLRVFESDAPHRASLQQVEILRDQIAKTIAGLRTMNDSIAYEFGVDRDAHTRTGALILKTALTSVPFFWNQLTALKDEQDLGFRREPGLIAMRKKLREDLDAMAASLAQKPAARLMAEDLASPDRFDAPHFREYAENTLEKHRELQTLVSLLNQ